MANTLAVFGGSFDPPHIAHVLVACWARAAANVDRVLVIPTFEHPFGKKSASFEHRMAMCRLAFRDLPHVSVDDVEASLGGESRTFHTLNELARRDPDALFRLVIGADILEDTDRWFRWDDVATIAPPLVVGRGGYPLPEECPITMPEISSTEIRRRFGKGEAVHGLVPVPVAEYAVENGLYL